MENQEVLKAIATLVDKVGRYHERLLQLEREKEIVLTKVEGISDNLAEQVARIVRSIRQIELKKSPSVSETLDWARTLVLLGVQSIDVEQAKESLHILLKYQSDIEKTAKELTVEG